MEDSIKHQQELIDSDHESAISLNFLADEFNREVPKEIADIISHSEFVRQSYDFNIDSILSKFVSEDGEIEFLRRPDSFIQIFRKFGSSEFGKLIADSMKNKDVIDLGCGAQNEVRLIAKEFGAKRYFGIDASLHVLEKQTQCTSRLKENNYNLPWKYQSRPFRKPGAETYLYSMKKGLDISDAMNDGSFPGYFIMDDSLGFLSKIPKLNGVVFVIGGMEGRSVPDRNGKDYFDYLSEEMARLTVDGDIILASLIPKKLPAILVKNGFVECGKVGDDYILGSMFIKCDSNETLGATLRYKFKQLLK